MSEEEEEIKIAHNLEEVEQALKQGYEVEQFIEKLEGIYVMRKPQPQAIEEPEEFVTTRIVDVREVSPEEVKALVEQGWEVSQRYKGCVQMILRKEVEEEENE